MGDVQGISYLRRRLSGCNNQGSVFLVGNCPRGNCPRGNCVGAIVLGENCLGGIVWVAIVLGGDFLGGIAWGNCPGGIDLLSIN